MSLMLSTSPDAIFCAVAASDDEQGPPASRCMTGSEPSQPPDDRDAIDARLIKRIATGDRQAFAQLYDRFSPPLYATAIRIVRDATEAQDIVHDAFLAVWEKASAFDTARGNAFSWVVTLVRNRAIDRLRMRRRRADLLAASTPADLGYIEDPPSASGDDKAA